MTMASRATTLASKKAKRQKRHRPHQQQLEHGHPPCLGVIIDRSRGEDGGLERSRTEVASGPRLTVSRWDDEAEIGIRERISIMGTLPCRIEDSSPSAHLVALCKKKAAGREEGESLTDKPGNLLAVLPDKVVLARDVLDDGHGDTVGH